MSSIYVYKTGKIGWSCDMDSKDNSLHLVEEKEYPVKVLFSRLDLNGSTVYGQDVCINREELLARLKWHGNCNHLIESIWDFQLSGCENEKLLDFFKDVYDMEINAISTVWEDIAMEEAMEKEFDAFLDSASAQDYHADCFSGDWGFVVSDKDSFNLTYKGETFLTCENNEITALLWGRSFNKLDMIDILKEVLDKVPGVYLDIKNVQMEEYLDLFGYTDGSVHFSDMPGCEEMSYLYDRAWVVSKKNAEDPAKLDFVMYWDCGNTWCSVMHVFTGITQEEFAKEMITKSADLISETIEEIRKLPLEKRDISEQIFLFEYWLSHKEELNQAANEFFGLSEVEYAAWNKEMTVFYEKLKIEETKKDSLDSIIAEVKETQKTESNKEISLHEREHEL